jgi:hypothetical protein
MSGIEWTSYGPAVTRLASFPKMDLQNPHIQAKKTYHKILQRITTTRTASGLKKVMVTGAIQETALPEGIKGACERYKRAVEKVV